VKLTEIYKTSSRSEDISKFNQYITDAPIVGSIRQMVLKKHIDQYGDIRYGLCDQDNMDKLIAFFHISKQPDNTFIATTPITDPQYQRQGWMKYLYNYAVLKDKLTLISDDNHTPEAAALWRALAQQGLYDIYMFNKKTKEKRPFNSGEDPWSIQNEKDWLLITEQLTQEDIVLQEQYSAKRGERAQRRKMGMDYPGLYGPGLDCPEVQNP